MEIGRRESIYKLATLMALIDISVEAVDTDDEALNVSVEEIAHRVVAYYWPQIRPFHAEGRLRQAKSGASIPDRIAIVREQLGTQGVRSPEAARELDHPAYRHLISSLRLTIAQQPLTHLQNVPSSIAHHDTGTDFLFDATRFRKKMTRAELSVRTRFDCVQVLELRSARLRPS